MHVKPQDVLSPQGSWELRSVIYDGGSGQPAISFGKWDGRPVIGIRWNGTSEPSENLGNPQSRGHATWFILPESIAVTTLSTLMEKQVAGNKHVAADKLADAVSAFGEHRRFAKDI